MQTIESGLYVHNDSLVQEGGHNNDDICEIEIEAVNLADSTQKQLKEKGKDICTDVDIEKEKDMVDDPVTLEELQSTESLLKLAPPTYEEQPDVVYKTRGVQ
ncbi:uncharacterized protein LOC110922247 [Helianthus annuus]|uniref:uncharacterized protein LOC110922247 n=1 Tax=Helianthus annuus TaxID=4232 RepID=UPI000B8F8DB1|nr:uncharacterized protein LOC110922247 [Helianthus annuus]